MPVSPEPPNQGASPRFLPPSTRATACNRSPGLAGRGWPSWARMLSRHHRDRLTPFLPESRPCPSPARPWSGHVPAAAKPRRQPQLPAAAERTSLGLDTGQMRCLPSATARRLPSTRFSHGMTLAKHQPDSRPGGHSESCGAKQPGGMGVSLCNALAGSQQPSPCPWASRGSIRTDQPPVMGACGAGASC